MSAPAPRLLVGAGSFAEARRALRLAELLRGRALGRVGGLLLADPLPGRLAEIPGQRLVSFGGELSPAPGRAAFARLASGDARAFEAALRAFAAQAGTGWSFERREAELAEGLLGAAADWDLVVIGQGADTAAAGRVVLVSARGDGPGPLYPLAADLAGRMGADLVESGLDAAGHARLGRMSVACLVIDRADALALGRAGLRALLDAARGPVLLAAPRAG